MKKRFRLAIMWLKGLFSKRAKRDYTIELASEKVLDALFEKQKKRNELKKDVFYWLRKKNKAKRLSDYHNAKIGWEKFKERFLETDTAIDVKQGQMKVYEHARNS
jgi:hypothetical protein